jgi:hypothetical protein
MFRFPLRKLLKLMALLPPLIGIAYLYRKAIREFIIDDVLMRGIP